MTSKFGNLRADALQIVGIRGCAVAADHIEQHLNGRKRGMRLRWHSAVRRLAGSLRDWHVSAAVDESAFKAIQAHGWHSVGPERCPPRSAIRGLGSPINKPRLKPARISVLRPQIS